MVNYCTADLARKYARDIPVTKVSDADIELYITGAESIIDEYTRHDWLLHSGQIEYHDGDAFSTLRLKEYPVVTLTTIHKRTAPSTWELLDPFDENTGEGDYVLDKPSNGIIEWVSGTNPGSGTRAVKVTYDWGYATVPDYIETLCAIMAAISTLAQAAGVESPSGLTSIANGALSLSWGGGPFIETIQLLTQQGDFILKDMIGRRLISVPTRG